LLSKVRNVKANSGSYSGNQQELGPPFTSYTFGHEDNCWAVTQLRGRSKTSDGFVQIITERGLLLLFWTFRWPGHETGQTPRLQPCFYSFY